MLEKRTILLTGFAPNTAAARDKRLSDGFEAQTLLGLPLVMKLDQAFTMSSASRLSSALEGKVGGWGGMMVQGCRSREQSAEQKVAWKNS